MTDPTDRRAQLEARNAAMRENVEGLLTDLRRRTADLAEAQARAAAVTASATSRDGLVRAEVNPAGVLTDLSFMPSAFQRSTPEKLARSVVEVAQAAANIARQQVEATMAPLQGGVTDLSDLIEGAPSFGDLLRPPAPPTPPPGRRSRAVDDDDDEGLGSIYGDGSR
ncbi:MAG: YbaB/EbfC family nucleoid-associated protein [Actinomycetota bacterium]|nr:YbaB/EbfC family nucleoid-associated protein [Actinomycetota bacterium]